LTIVANTLLHVLKFVKRFYSTLFFTLDTVDFGV